MRLQEPLPVAPAAQRSVSAAWERVVHDGPTALTGLESVRPAVRESWQRSLHRGIAPSMPRAPLAINAADLDAIRFDVDWLPHAEVAIRAHANGSLLDGHIVALFDANARMLAATGDPAALEGLSDINFRPGALWSEEAVGTNGPGTALALGRSIHIIGAEHFCAGWHGWHCAAAPIRDPLTQQVIGVLDLSGFRDRAHPHTLSLATAIAVAVEQRLIAREAERRVSLLRQYSTLVSRYPTDAVLVVDRAGDIMASTSAAERLVRRLAASGRDATDALRIIGTDARFRTHTSRHGALASMHEATHPLLGATAAVHALHDGRTAIGACLVIPTATRRGAGRAAPAPASTPLVPRQWPASASTSPPSSPAPPTRYALASLHGQAPVLDEVRRFARSCARTDLPVLLLGESGTGKEVLAQGIHAASPRANGPFVAVNCAALPRELVESELFGHVAGAFSGARAEGAIGKFEAADGGTLFLDEIGELPSAAQAALLRVLQEGEVTRLGSHQGRTVDVRIVAATNRDIMQAIASGILRDDLYHRLNVLTLALPPLREREGDAVLLAHHFLGQVRGSLATSFAPDVLEAFARYAWPGNVRELQNLVLRVAALSEDAVITRDLLPTAVRDALPRGRRTVMPTSPRMPVAGASLAMTSPDTDSSSPARDATRHHYAELIAGHATMQDAAAALGVTRSTLYRRLQRLGLAPGRSVRGIS